MCAALSRECVWAWGFCRLLRPRSAVRIPMRGEIHEICLSGSEEEKTKFYRNLSHTIRNYGLEISYGSHSKLLDTPNCHDRTILTRQPVLRHCYCPLSVFRLSPMSFPLECGKLLSMNTESRHQLDTQILRNFCGNTHTRRQSPTICTPAL